MDDRRLGLALRALRRRRHWGLEARVELDVRYKGAEIDRLIDERHAAIVDAVVKRLTRLGWIVRTEVTYEIGWSRGSFDILAFHPKDRALANVEVKSELGAVEATLRRHDDKARVAGEVAVRRFGWRAEHVGSFLVLGDTMTARRQIARHSSIFDASLPLRGREVVRWFREPRSSASGLWFLSLTAGSGRRGNLRSVSRVRLLRHAGPPAQTAIE